MPLEVEEVLQKLDWMRDERMWPNGARYLWTTDAIAALLRHVPLERRVRPGRDHARNGVFVAVSREAHLPKRRLTAVAAREQQELVRRERAYRGDRPAPTIRGRTIILIDDGLATGSTMRAALAALRRQQPDQIVVAVPIAAPETCDEFRAEVDEIIRKGGARLARAGSRDGRDVS